MSNFKRVEMVPFFTSNIMGLGFLYPCCSVGHKYAEFILTNQNVEFEGLSFGYYFVYLSSDRLN